MSLGLIHSISTGSYRIYPFISWLADSPLHSALQNDQICPFTPHTQQGNFNLPLITWRDKFYYSFLNDSGLMKSCILKLCMLSSFNLLALFESSVKFFFSSLRKNCPLAFIFPLNFEWNSRGDKILGLVHF